MSKFKKEFEFNLTEPLNFQSQTGEMTSKILLLKAPSNKHQYYLNKLRKNLVTALMKTGQQAPNVSKIKIDKKDEKVELDATTILFILYGSDINLDEYMEIFWEMILDGLCLIDRITPLTKSLLDDIHYEDQTEIIGEYTVNFIVPSWMKRQLKT